MRAYSVDLRRNLRVCTTRLGHWTWKEGGKVEEKGSRGTRVTMTRDSHRIVLRLVIIVGGLLDEYDAFSQDYRPVL